MCPMEKSNLVTCQLTYFPVLTDNYMGDIKDVLAIIKASDLKHEIGPLSTFVSGEVAKVFQLLESIYSHMNNKECGFTMNVMLSNRCGCSL